MSVNRKRRPKHTAGPPAPPATPATNSAGWLIGEAVGRLNLLREAWPWLAPLREPGTRDTVHERPVSARAEAVRVAQWRKDRAAAAEAVRTGKIPSTPKAAAANLSAVHARHKIAADLAALAAKVLAATDRPTRRPVVRTGTHVLVGACSRCHGTGAVPPPAWWPPDRPWPGGLTCGCSGDVCRWGHRLPGQDDVRWHGVPREALPCRCEGTGAMVRLATYDLPDAVVGAALTALAEALPAVDDELTAAQAMGTLDRCNALARTVARVDTEDLRRLPARCPACRRRELVADVGSPDELDWSIRCASPLCRCTGPDCGCGRAVRYARRRHRWPAAEWQGPDGLAARLGVDMGALARGQLGRATRRGVPLTHTTAGHGGRA